MNFDRGFIKWQPFNSVIQSKTILNNLNQNKFQEKPILFPEELENLNKAVSEAYYAHNLIELTIYEENKIKKYVSIIVKINTNTNTIKLKNNKIISFEQILHIKNIKFDQ